MGLFSRVASYLVSAASVVSAHLGLPENKRDQQAPTATTSSPKDVFSALSNPFQGIVDKTSGIRPSETPIKNIIAKGKEFSGGENTDDRTGIYSDGITMVFGEGLTGVHGGSPTRVFENGPTRIIHKVGSGLDNNRLSELVGRRISTTWAHRHTEPEPIELRDEDLLESTVPDDTAVIPPERSPPTVKELMIDETTSYRADTQPFLLRKPEHVPPEERVETFDFELVPAVDTDPTEVDPNNAINPLRGNSGTRLRIRSKTQETPQRPNLQQICGGIFLSIQSGDWEKAREKILSFMDRELDISLIDFTREVFEKIVREFLEPALHAKVINFHKISMGVKLLKECLPLSERQEEQLDTLIIINPNFSRLGTSQNLDEFSASLRLIEENRNGRIPRSSDETIRDINKLLELTKKDTQRVGILAIIRASWILERYLCCVRISPKNETTLREAMDILSKRTAEAKLTDNEKKHLKFMRDVSGELRRLTPSTTPETLSQLLVYIEYAKRRNFPLQDLIAPHIASNIFELSKTAKDNESRKLFETLSTLLTNQTSSATTVYTQAA